MKDGGYRVPPAGDVVGLALQQAVPKLPYEAFVCNALLVATSLKLRGWLDVFCVLLSMALTTYLFVRHVRAMRRWKSAVTAWERIKGNFS